MCVIFAPCIIDKCHHGKVTNSSLEFYWISNSLWIPVSVGPIFDSIPLGNLHPILISSQIHILLLPFTIETVFNENINYRLLQQHLQYQNLLGTIYQHIVVLTQHWNMPMAASCETTITPLRASHSSQETILRVYAIVNGSFPFQYEIIINRAFQHGLIKPVLN